MPLISISLSYHFILPIRFQTKKAQTTPVIRGTNHGTVDSMRVSGMLFFFKVVCYLTLFKLSCYSTLGKITTCGCSVILCSRRLLLLRPGRSSPPPTED